MPVRSMAAFPPSSPRIRRQPSRRQSAQEASSDGESDDASSCASLSSLDEEAVNCRMSPYWCAYRSIIEARGFRLDTCRDVKQWYHDYWAAQASEGRTVTQDLPGYLRACRGQDENELCRDAGLVSTALAVSSLIVLTLDCCVATARSSLSWDAVLDRGQSGYQGCSLE